MSDYNFQKHKKYHVYIRLLIFARQYWLAFALGLLGNILMAAANASFTGLLKPI